MPQRAIYQVLLNALRHQKFWHDREDDQPSDRYEVLNALRHQRFWHTPSQNPQNPTASCAQRLTASKVLARSISTSTNKEMVVLNALRHQRFWHPKPNILGRIVERVLNALRHQRFWHRAPQKPCCISAQRQPCKHPAFRRTPNQQTRSKPIQPTSQKTRKA